MASSRSLLLLLQSPPCIWRRSSCLKRPSWNLRNFRIQCWIKLNSLLHLVSSTKAFLSPLPLLMASLASCSLGRCICLSRRPLLSDRPGSRTSTERSRSRQRRTTRSSLSLSTVRGESSASPFVLYKGNYFSENKRSNMRNAARWKPNSQAHDMNLEITFLRWGNQKNIY